MADAGDTITLTVNGQERSVTTDPRRPLLFVLREDLGLTGTKFGCGEGQCAACTVLLDGQRTFSCLTPVEAAVGKSVTTIEGLAEPDGTLHPAQEAFLEEAAFQCGYCTPGMIMSTVALMNEKPDGASDDEVRSWMNRHLCRCCGYARIAKAVKRATELSAAAADVPQAGR